MSIIVRPAVGADLDDLISLNAVVQRLHVESEPTHFKSDIHVDDVRAFFSTLLISDHNFVQIAQWNDSSTGYIWFEWENRQSTPFTLPVSRLYIHHIVVREDTRRFGVASALLDGVEREARARGIAQIVLDTWAFNKDAQACVEKLGFTPFNIVLRKQMN